MTAARLDAILAKLPKHRRKTAKASILAAEVAGYEGIGLWEWLPGAAMSEFDLVGFDGRGNLRFLEIIGPKEMDNQ